LQAKAKQAEQAKQAEIKIQQQQREAQVHTFTTPAFPKLSLA
jgi:hypothetical protein